MGRTWQAPAALTAALMALMLAAGWLEDDAEVERRQREISRCVSSGTSEPGWTIVGTEEKEGRLFVYAKNRSGIFFKWECLVNAIEFNKTGK
jgi:hypothetical protein